MNLQEQITRTKELMGLINEASESCCKRKLLNPTSIYTFWYDKSKTDEERLKTMKELVDPFFTKAIDYYRKYLNGEWFTKKINETLQKYSPKLDTYKKRLEELKKQLEQQKNNNEPQSKIEETQSNIETLEDLIKQKSIIWDETQVKNLESFLDSIKLVYKLNCQLDVGGFVKKEEYSIVYFCPKITWPEDSSSNWYQILVHEIKHSIAYYFENLGVPITPESEVLQFENSSDPDEVTTKKYAVNTKENSSRIQNLRIFLGVDDFVSVENLKNLLKKSLTVKSYKDLERNLDVVYENNTLKIYTNFIFDNKNPFSGYLPLYFNGEKSIDIPALFSNFYTITKQESGDIVNVDLEKLFNYSQQFAKVDNNKNNNYA